MRVTTSTLGARGSLRRWRYCVGARLKFWRRSPVPKKGVGTRRLPLVTAAPSNLTRLYYNGSVAKSHSTTTQYRQLRRLCQRLFMRGCQFRSSLKKWPARKASGPERHPFDSAEPIIIQPRLYQNIQNLDVLLIGSLEISNVSYALIGLHVRLELEISDACMYGRFR